MKTIEATYLTALYLRQELLYFRNIYRTSSIGCFDFFMKLKPHLIALNNVKDFIDEISIYIRDNNALVEKRKSITLSLECCKYLRNKVCGHLDDDFCEMAKKWEVSSLYKAPDNEDAERVKRSRTDFFVKALIESAINSFRVDNPTQKFFSGEIDILYPPNYKNFMNFIGICNENCIELLTDIADHVEPQIHFYDGMSEALGAIYEASQMDFGSKKCT